MSYELTDYSLQHLLTCAAELGAKRTLCGLGKLKPYLSKAEAFRLFGRANIERWLEPGLLTPRKDGDHAAQWRINRIEAESFKNALELSRLLDS